MTTNNKMTLVITQTMTSIMITMIMMTFKMISKAQMMTIPSHQKEHKACGEENGVRRDNTPTMSVALPSLSPKNLPTPVSTITDQTEQVGEVLCQFCKELKTLSRVNY